MSTMMTKLIPGKLYRCISHIPIPTRRGGPVAYGELFMFLSQVKLNDEDSKFIFLAKNRILDIKARTNFVHVNYFRLEGN